MPVVHEQNAVTHRERKVKGKDEDRRAVGVGALTITESSHMCSVLFIYFVSPFFCPPPHQCNVKDGRCVQCGACLVEGYRFCHPILRGRKCEVTSVLNQCGVRDVCVCVCVCV